MLVFDIKMPFFQKKSIFSEKMTQKCLFFKKKFFGPKFFFRPKMPKKSYFSIKNVFLVIKRGFGGQNGRKWSKNGQKTILDQKKFRPFLDHFGPFWHQKSFFSPKKPIFVQNKYFERKKNFDEKF